MKRIYLGGYIEKAGKQERFEGKVPFDLDEGDQYESIMDGKKVLHTITNKTMLSDGTLMVQTDFIELEPLQPVITAPLDATEEEAKGILQKFKSWFGGGI
jgi:hypothetical protein